MKTDRLVLSIETSLKEGSLSLLSGESELGNWQGNKVVSRSEDLVSGIQEIFETSHKNIKELNLIAVSVGPGSFTGLRVGIACGKGLAHALNCRLVGIPILDSMAFFYSQKSFQKKKIICLAGAGRGHAYFQIFDGERGFFEPLSAIQLATDFELSKELTDNNNAVVVCEANLPDDLIVLRESGVDLTVIRENMSKYVGLYAQTKFEDFMLEDAALGTGFVTPIYVRDV